MPIKKGGIAHGVKMLINNRVRFSPARETKRARWTSFWSAQFDEENL